jgi:hypothetical protein
MRLGSKHILFMGRYSRPVFPPAGFQRTAG